MNKPLRRTVRYFYLIIMCCTAGCAPDLVKKQQAFDFSNIGRIQLQLEGIDPSVSPSDIGQQVSKNLADWNYPIGAKGSQSYSHVLKAAVGKIEHGSTPIGFSFSSGNSDPRAVEFQKADVLPISCQLIAIAHPEQTGELNMELMVSEHDKHVLASSKLADHISTVCFNLLRELKWPEYPKNEAYETIKPSWIPEIRIETKQAPSPVKQDKSGNDRDTMNVENQTPDNIGSRKQIIIHNQGSPMIFQFGHERK